MKCNKKVFDYLSNYFSNLTDNSADLREELNSFYDAANALIKLNKITLAEHDCLCYAMADLIDFVIEAISSCPDLFIILNGGNRTKSFKGLQ